MPRSGSMWAFNIIRELYFLEGFDVVPDRIPHTDLDMIECGNANAYNRNLNQVAILKIHSRIEVPPYPAKFVVTSRDPRDALISFMRFTGCDFETGLASLIEWTKTCDHYNSYPSEITCLLDYGEIRDAPDNSIKKIADFLGLDLSDNVCNEIKTKFSKENVGRNIEDNDLRYQQKKSKQIEVAADEVVKGNLPNSVERVFDVKTGFQTGHTSNYVDGDWQEMLTASQISKINKAAGKWLKNNNYD